MKFRVKVGYGISKRWEVYEFADRTLAFKFAESLFDEKNDVSPDPVTAILIGPKVTFINQ
jgi:hypothetical protein